MTVNYLVQSSSYYIAFGLSSDTKPEGSASSAFIEIDTARVYSYSGEWTQSVPNITTLSGYTGNTAHFLRADSTFAAPSGGSDPWTYLKVTTHFGTSSNVLKDIPGLNLVPGTNSTYEWESVLMLRTSTTTVNPRIGWRWPTGTSSVIWCNQSQSTLTQLMAFGNNVSSFLTAVGALATTTGSWPCIMGGVIDAYGAAGSSFALRIAAETDGVFVSTMSGSFLKYRTI